MLRFPSPSAARRGPFALHWGADFSRIGTKCTPLIRSGKRSHVKETPITNSYIAANLTARSAKNRYEFGNYAVKIP